MKYLVLFAVLMVAYTLWKNQRVRERAEREAGRTPPGTGRPGARAGTATQEMVRCPVCDLHLPRADAVADAQGRLFCSAAHRDKANA